MADSAAPVALPEAEQRAAEALLTRAFGEPTASFQRAPRGAAGHAILARRTGIAVRGEATLDAPGGPLKEFMDESSPGVPDPRPATGAAAAVVLRQSRLQRDGLFGALVAAFLTIAGTGTTIPLPFFSVREVRRQCLAVGWSFARRR
jgi:hypothetical protein